MVVLIVGRVLVVAVVVNRLLLLLIRVLNRDFIVWFGLYYLNLEIYGI